MVRAAVGLSLFGLLLTVVTTRPVRVRRALDSLTFSWQMQMRAKIDSKLPFSLDHLTLLYSLHSYSFFS